MVRIGVSIFTFDKYVASIHLSSNLQWNYHCPQLPDYKIKELSVLSEVTELESGIARCRIRSLNFQNSDS